MRLRLSTGRLRMWRDGAEVLLVAAILALFVRTFFVQAYRIPSESMEPAMMVGDHLLINKFVFGAGAGRWGPLVPQREVRPGDLVTFRGIEDPEHELLKRCVATGGAEVEIDSKKLQVDGRPIDETGYVDHSDERVYPRSEFLHESFWRRDAYGPERMPEDSLFCLGDNRDISRDSRFFGPVGTELVRGRPLLVYWSRDAEAGRWAIRWRRTLHIPR